MLEKRQPDAGGLTRALWEGSLAAGLISNLYTSETTSSFNRQDILFIGDQRGTAIFAFNPR